MPDPTLSAPRLTPVHSLWRRARSTLNRYAGGALLSGAGAGGAGVSGFFALAEYDHRSNIDYSGFMDSQLVYSLPELCVCLGAYVALTGVAGLFVHKTERSHQILTSAVTLRQERSAMKTTAFDLTSRPVSSLGLAMLGIGLWAGALSCPYILDALGNLSFTLPEANWFKLLAPPTIMGLIANSNRNHIKQTLSLLEAKDMPVAPAKPRADESTGKQNKSAPKI